MHIFYSPRSIQTEDAVSQTTTHHFLSFALNYMYLNTSGLSAVCLMLRRCKRRDCKTMEKMQIFIVRNIMKTLSCANPQSMESSRKYLKMKYINETWVNENL